jgi:hypothetical protein
MPWMIPAAIVGSSLLGSAAAGDAGDAQADAASHAADLENARFEQNRTDMAPWREAGLGALDQLKTGLGPNGEFNKTFSLADFVRDPGYQFRMGEGMRGLQNSAAVRGMLQSGGTLKALSRYGQDYASGEYSNAYNRFNNDLTSRFNRLSSLAGTSQTATRDVANMGSQSVANVGNYLTQAGNATASGYVGGANAIGNGVSSMANWYQQNQLMNKMFPSGGVPAVGMGSNPSGYAGSYNNPSAYVAPGG